MTTISIFQWICVAIIQHSKLRTGIYILASSHHDRMRGAMLFCPGVTVSSSNQSMKLYETPIDKQHKYEQNLKRIMRLSLVDVGLLIARTFLNDCIHCELHCYNTADADDLATQRTRSSSAIVLSICNYITIYRGMQLLIHAPCDCFW